MYHRQLAKHRMSRNLTLAAGWVLIIAGCATPFLWLLLVGGLLVNAYAYYLMAADKRLAKRHGFRVPEASLLTVAALGGGIGALAGMLGFRHKTKHASFLILVPVFCILQVFLLLHGIGRM